MYVYMYVYKKKEIMQDWGNVGLKEDKLSLNYSFNWSQGYKKK